MASRRVPRMLFALSSCGLIFFTAHVWLARSHPSASAQPPKPPYRIFELADKTISRRQRGDFVPPDVVAFVGEGEWEDELAEMISIAAAETEVELLVDPETTTEADTRAWLATIGVPDKDVDVVLAPMDSPWIRDYGPLQAFVGRDVIWLDPFYGHARPLDDAIPEQLAAVHGARIERISDRLDGGALISNGRGLCASTLEYFEQSWIDLDDDLVREELMSVLGCPVLVLVPALPEEQTHHIDMFAQFVAADVVAIADLETSDAAAAAIREAAARMGEQMEVVRVPMPHLGTGEYRTYLNGLMLRHTYLAPSYSDVPAAIEARAIEALTRAMPATHLVPIPADKMIKRFGALHCVSLGLSLAH